MIFIEITTVKQIVDVIEGNSKDTTVEIRQFNNPELAISLMEYLPQEVTHFAFFDIAQDALGIFIDAIGKRLSNYIPNQPAITIELGKREEVAYIEEIKNILMGYGLNLNLITFLSHDLKVININTVIPKLSLPKETAQQQFPDDVEAQQFQRMALDHSTPIKSGANKTVYESPLSPRSPRSVNGGVIELQDFSSTSDDPNNPPLSQPEITSDDIENVVANLTDLNLALFSVVNNLQKFQPRDHSVPSQPLLSDSTNHSFMEHERKDECDFVIRSRIVRPLQIMPRSHCVNLAKLAAENSVARAPIKQTGQNEIESSPPNGWVRAPTAPPIPKQSTPGELAEVKAWWEQQKAKPPRKPPSRLQRVLEQIQEEDRKEKKSPPGNQFYQP